MESGDEWLQYSIDDESSWIKYTEAFDITENNIKIIARLYDGTNEVKRVETTVTNIDLAGPKINNVILKDRTQNTITIEVEAEDEGCGLASEQTYEYYVEGVLDETNTENIHTFSNLDQNKEYNFTIVAYDKLRNKTQVNKEFKTLEIVDASKLKDKLEAPNSVIGKKVEGIKLVTKNKYEWKIFYVDEENIYLISSDYFYKDDIPYKTETNLITDRSKGYQLSMNNVINDYKDGSKLITDPDIKNLISMFTIESADINMQAVAYMLDKDIWTPKIVDDTNVKYVIGGPSVELVFKSYNAKYKTKYESMLNTTKKGYDVRISPDTEWGGGFANMINTSDTAYVTGSIDKAQAMWLASPSSAANSSVMDLGEAGYVFNNYYNGYNAGFRPIICLNKGTKLLDLLNDNYKIINE